MCVCFALLVRQSRRDCRATCIHRSDDLCRHAIHCISHYRIACTTQCISCQGPSLSALRLPAPAAGLPHPLSPSKVLHQRRRQSQSKGAGEYEVFSPCQPYAGWCRLVIKRSGDRRSAMVTIQLSALRFCTAPDHCPQHPFPLGCAFVCYTAVCCLRDQHNSIDTPAAAVDQSTVWLQHGWA